MRVLNVQCRSCGRTGKQVGVKELKVDDSRGGIRGSLEGFEEAEQRKSDYGTVVMARVKDLNGQVVGTMERRFVIRTWMRFVVAVMNDSDKWRLVESGRPRTGSTRS